MLSKPALASTVTALGQGRLSLPHALASSLLLLVDRTGIGVGVGDRLRSWLHRRR